MLRKHGWRRTTPTLQPPPNVKTAVFAPWMREAADPSLTVGARKRAEEQRRKAEDDKRRMQERGRKQNAGPRDITGAPTQNLGGFADGQDGSGGVDGARPGGGLPTSPITSPARGAPQ
jgi:hypothetical protein